jgi:hypothetical protein
MLKKGSSGFTAPGLLRRHLSHKNGQSATANQFSMGAWRKCSNHRRQLFVTNRNRVEKTASAGSCNAVLIKLNQACTASKSIAALEAAEKAGWRVRRNDKSKR